MSDVQPILFAKGDVDLVLLPKMSNRHGLIAGATGTGKTISLKVLAESFSAIGVPVFLSDIKGDLASICSQGEINPKIEERIKSLNLTNFTFQHYPVALWDVFGQLGHPIRTTISDMGPLLLGRLLGLNETQSGILNILFKVADDEGALLIDLKDLRAMLKFIGDNASDYTTEYGNVTKQSIGTIQRSLLTLEQQGGEQFFGEPAFDIKDFMRVNEDGYGYVNVLAAENLYSSPALYSTFLLWLLSELFEVLPEVGDIEKPKIVFFFDEAHLLFEDAPKALLDKVEQVVRLVRSKGVGIYFITQNPADIPDRVLGQLGNKVQHALRAFTPKDQFAVKAASDSFRANPKLNTETAILDLRVGEALISFLEQDGRPSMVERGFVLPPKSMIGTISPEKRMEILSQSAFNYKYNTMIDRESAFEMLARRVNQNQLAAEALSQKEIQHDPNQERYNETAPRQRSANTGMERAAKSFMTSLGSQVGREVVRGILGSLLKR
jgi:DNA helicase HerA-like ATPase